MKNKLQKKIEDMFEKGILLSQDSLDQELDEILLEKIKAEEDLIVLNSDFSVFRTKPEEKKSAQTAL